MLFLGGEICIVIGLGLDYFLENVENMFWVIDVFIFFFVECRISVCWLIDRMLCLGYIERVLDICKGDSGGFFVCYNKGKFYLGGIVSYGKRCFRVCLLNIYMNVKYFKFWIIYIIKIY